MNLNNSKKTIHSKMFFYFIIVLLLPTVIISISTYIISLNILKDKVSSSFSNTLLYVRNTVEREIEQVNKISDYMFIDNDIKTAITSGNKSKYEATINIEKADQILKNYSISNIFRNINVVKLYGFEGTKISFAVDDTVSTFDDEKITKSTWFKKALNNSGQTLWTGMGEKYKVNNTNNTYDNKKYDISIFRVIKNKDYSKNIGVMYMSLQPQVFSKLVENLKINGDNQIYILDNNNAVVNNSNNQLTNLKIDKIINSIGNKKIDSVINEKDMIIFYYYIKNSDWKVIGVIPLKLLTNDNKNILYATAIAFIISFFFAVLIWYFVSSSIVKPITNITKTMKAVRHGELKARVVKTTNDEIGILGDNFNYMIDKLEILFKENMEKQINIKDSEYRALQAQINPHFLYNTLNSIRWMAIIQKADNIKRAVDSLANLMKNATNKIDMYITVKDEIDNLNSYIYLQKIAYKNKFEVEWDVEETVLSDKCLKFILQPIVENSIFHGIEPKQGCGLISIIIKKQGEILEFSVKDNGIGMTLQQIEEILNTSSKKMGMFSGIGIGNVNERIKLIYGNEYGIEITSEINSLTEVLIKIPIMQ